MSKSNTFEIDLLAKVFHDTEFAWLPLANLYIALHTGDPGEGGSQSTNECDYTGYARVAVPRDGSGWAISASGASNAAVILFPTCSGGANAATHFSIGTAGTGEGQLLYSGALSSSLAVSNNVRPEFAVGTLVVQED